MREVCDYNNHHESVGQVDALLDTRMILINVSLFLPSLNPSVAQARETYLFEILPTLALFRKS